MIIRGKMVKNTFVFIFSYPVVAFNSVLNAEILKLFLPLVSIFDKDSMVTEQGPK